jgi:hypothetical protein
LTARHLACARFNADDLAEIDPSNIISGSRTRGKKIDFSKAEPVEGDEDE